MGHKKCKQSTRSNVFWPGPGFRRPCRFMEPRFREPLNGGTRSMNPLLEEALLSTVSWLRCRREFQPSFQELPSDEGACSHLSRQR